MSEGAATLRGHRPAGLIESRRGRWRRPPGALDEIAALARRLGAADAPPGWPDDAKALGEAERIARALVRGRAAERPSPALAEAAVTLAAAALARAGRRVHVISLDGGARRLAETSIARLAAIGVQAATLEPGVGAARRRAAHRAPVLFADAREIALDLLRAELGSGAPTPLRRRLAALAPANGTRWCGSAMPPPDAAIFLDGEESLCRRALTMVVAFRPHEVRASRVARLEAEQVLGLAAQFRPGIDFVAGSGTPALSSAGRRRLARLAPALGGAWHDPVRAEIGVCRALAALHVWRRDRHYEIDADGVVTFLDPALATLDASEEESGFLPPRILVGLVEGAPHEAEAEGLRERVPMRSLWRRYRQIGALVGDLRRHRRELGAAYALGTVPAPPPPAPDAVAFGTAELAAILARLMSPGGRGRGVLLVGGDAETAAAVARAVQTAFRGKAPAEVVAEIPGAELVEGCQWARDPAGLGAAPSPPPLVVGLGGENFPGDGPWLAARRVLLVPDPAVSAAPAALRRLAVMLGGSAGPARAALPRRLLARHLLLREARAEARLRDRLHAFDVACRRAVAPFTRPLGGSD